MSQKKHVILPRGCAVAEADSFLALPNRDRESAFDRFPRFTNQQVNGLKAADRITPLGASGKVWQWKDDLPAHASKPSEGGRVSLEIPFALRSFIESEMSGRRSWSLSW